MKAKNSIKKTLSAILIIAFVLQLLCFTSCSNVFDSEWGGAESSDDMVAIIDWISFDSADEFAEAVQNDSFNDSDRHVMNRWFPKDENGNVCLPALDEIYVPIFPEEVYSCSYTWFSDGSIYGGGYMKNDVEKRMAMYKEKNPEKEFTILDYKTDDASPFFAVSKPSYDDTDAEKFRDIEQFDCSLTSLFYITAIDVISEEILEDGSLLINWKYGYYERTQHTMQTTVTTIEKDGITYHIRKDYWIEANDDSEQEIPGAPSTTIPAQIWVFAETADFSFFVNYETFGFTDYDNDLLTSIRYVTYPEYLNMKQTVTEDNAD